MAHYFICQHCRKTFEDSHNPGRNPRFCSLECYWDSQRVVNICEICSKTFKTIKSQTRKYCSKECRLEVCWGTPACPTKHSVFVCDWCGKEFKEWTYRQPRFCSNQCRSEFAARQPKPRKIPTQYVTLVCDHCAQTYEIKQSMHILRPSRFCSGACRYAQKSIAMRGENNPMWTGGENPDGYGPNWDSQSKKAKNRDKHTCQICGYRSGGDHILDVHHIIKAREFNGEWKKANRLSNLVSLCRPCHIKVEHGNIEFPNSKHLKENAQV